MNDLLQSQIRDSCRLALPEGLKDLMSDISREVLRAQPQDLYHFIADYLSALLVAREHLFIAARVCDDVCKNRCCKELEDELRGLSLSEEDVQEILDITADYFSSGAGKIYSAKDFNTRTRSYEQFTRNFCILRWNGAICRINYELVKEGSLLQKLMRKTSVRQEDLGFIQEAVRRSFLRHQVNQTAPSELSSTDSEMDETTIAAKHTLKIYKKSTEQPDINYDCVASKIQAAYRAYNVRRKSAHARSEAASGRRTDNNNKIRFHVKQDKPVAELVKTKSCASNCSAESLAGSFVLLPPYKPYHIDQRSTVAEQDEIEKEKEHSTFDYVQNVNSWSPQEYHEYNEIEVKTFKKAISFHDLPNVVEVDYNEMSDEMDETECEFEEVDENESEQQISDEEKVINVASHNDDFGDEMTTENLTNESEYDKTLVNENDDQMQETETQRATKDWVSDADDSSEVTPDDDFDDDVTRDDDRNDEDNKDTSSEISTINEGDDENVDENYEDVDENNEDVDEAYEAVADDMDLMTANQTDDGNKQI